MKYYAVLFQNEKEIFTSWDVCKEYIKGKKGVIYKSFLTEKEARQFLNQEPLSQSFQLPTAYIDGSYDSKTGCYSFGGVLIVQEKCYKFSKKYEKDEYSSARNVAGEIKGAGYIIQYAIHHQIEELNLIYDYEGIEKWYTGVWKANSAIAKAYTSFRNQVQNKIKIHFIKVKSHSNDTYNDMADQLAKSALGI
ncbi:MAG: ribonuclease H family protein [Anaeroplasmataceae bacterium]|nr:ribonuclease H family protein [Anaeroplasmataceae bacterium]